MGKKSRNKQLRRQEQAVATKSQTFEESEKKETGLALLLLWIVRVGAYLSLLTPLLVSSKFFFPFVGPKSLYFMFLAQLIIFSWFGLLIISKRYRPKINVLGVTLLVMLFLFSLSAIFGVNPSYSFWSKYERMTGILMFLHLTGFFFAVTSVFKREKDWRKMFVVSIITGLVVTVMSLTNEGGSSRGGATVGNTSFMGTYLLFNIFFALYLFFKQKNLYWKIGTGLSAGLMILAVYLASARASTLAIFGGLFLFALLYLAFVPKKKIITIVGKTLLVVSIITFIAGALMVFQEDNFVKNYFTEKATKSRLVIWEKAWAGFKEKPILGWGPENFEFIFNKHFNPCMFLSECGGEIWFDRAHNVIFDMLSTTGILGFLAYLAVFISAFFVLWRQYLKEKIGFLACAIPTVILVAYIVQNLTVFDMISSYLMFFITLCFINVAVSKKEPDQTEKPVKPRKWALWTLLIIFFISVFGFVIQPVRQGSAVIKALSTSDSSERLEFYNKSFYTTPMGVFQIKEFLADKTLNAISSVINDVEDPSQINQALISKEMDLVIKALKENVEASPLDFRSVLRLGQLYNLYATLDVTKLELAEEWALKGVEMAPTNQQAYWNYAQNKLYQRDTESAFELTQQAIDLEPRLIRSHSIALQVAKFAGDMEKGEELLKKALEINPAWEEELRQILGDEMVTK